MKRLRDLDHGGFEIPVPKNGKRQSVQSVQSVWSVRSGQSLNREAESRMRE